MAQGEGSSGGEGLELKTLVIAALASATAAIVVSHLWKGGTVIAAAMTPVIVAIAKELIARPMESEVVRKPVQRVSQVAAMPVRRVVPRISARGGVRGVEADHDRQATEPLGHDEQQPPPRTQPLQQDTRALPPTEPHTTADAGFTPIRTYGGGGRRRPPHLKVALVTGLLAFVIGALALTLPELLFGGAVGSGSSTTLFSSNSSSKSKSKDKSGRDKSKAGGDKGTATTPDNQPGGQTTTPTTPAPTTGAKPPPATTTPAPSTTPQQPTPAPTTPAPALPPSPPTP